MSPDQLTGLAKFWADYGNAATGILVVACFGLIGGALWLKSWFGQLKGLTETISKIALSCLDSEGHPVRQQEYHARIRELLVEMKTLIEIHERATNEHFDDVKRLSDDEHWKNCPVDKCPNFGKILAAYQEMVAKFEVYEVRSVENRTRTNETLDELTKELMALGREIIATLRSQREPHRDTQLDTIGR